MHDLFPRAFDQDCSLDSFFNSTDTSDNAPILSSLCAYCRMVGLLLCLRVRQKQSLMRLVQSRTEHGGLETFADDLQIRSKGMEKPYLGPCSASPREHFLRRKSKQYSIGPHKHISRCHGVAPLWYDTFWCPCRLLGHHFHICITWYAACLRQELWVHEFSWRHHSNDVSLFTTVVREPLWPRAGQLLHPRIACWFGSH